jgi:hypothetical protein
MGRPKGVAGKDYPWRAKVFDNQSHPAVDLAGVAGIPDGSRLFTKWLKSREHPLSDFFALVMPSADQTVKIFKGRITSSTMSRTKPSAMPVRFSTLTRSFYDDLVVVLD